MMFISFCVIFASLMKDSYSLEIILLAHNRTKATLGCLESLKNAFYPPPKGEISLEIHVDLCGGGERERLLMSLSLFNWPHGEKRLIMNGEHLGLQRQWLSIHARDLTLIVEDDLIFSPFYHYIIEKTKRLLSEENVFGMALQRPQWQQGINERGKWRRLDRLTSTHPPVFRFPGPATWGFVVLPEKWNRFRRWAAEFLLDPGRQYTKGAISSKWKDERGEDALISPLMFEFLLRFNMDLVYFWTGNHTSIVTSTMERNNKGYYRDRLLDDVETVNDLIARRSATRMPRFTLCMDRIDHVEARGTGEASISCHYREGLYPDSVS